MSVIRKISYSVLLAVISMPLVAGFAVAGDFDTSSKQWETEYNAGNAAGVAALYTEDGMILPPDTTSVQGRDSIKAWVEKDIAANKGNKVQIATVESSQSGDLGFARGTFKFLDASGKAFVEGKWIEVRKKVGGKWYISRDIWNTDTAMPAQQ